MSTAPEIRSLGAQKWHELVLHDLTAVVVFLDRLGRVGCLLREVHAFGKWGFAVRWYS